MNYFYETLLWYLLPHVFYSTQYTRAIISNMTASVVTELVFYRFPRDFHQVFVLDMKLNIFARIMIITILLLYCRNIHIT